MSFVNPINKSYCLEIICESNYQKLLRLVPDLLSFKESATGIAHHQSNLYLKVLALSPYTMTIELSHCFNTPSDRFVEPALHIRLYLDAQIAEVLNDHNRPQVTQVYKNPSLSTEIMNYKWRLNYFLQKWLDHCLKKQYQFDPKNT